jgi:hypothetical protein
MKIKSIIIILLILSMSFSPSLISAYEYKLPTKLSEDEFKKRLQNYIDTPDELKIYVPDIIREDDEVDFMTLYNVSQNINITENDKITQIEQSPMVKNMNAVVYESAIKLRDFDAASRSNAVYSFMDAYSSDVNSYMPLIYYAETAKTIKFLADTNLKLFIDNYYSGMEGLDPFGYVKIPGRDLLMCHKELFQRIMDSEVTWDGYFFAPARGRYSEFKMSVEEVAKIFDTNYYLVDEYDQLGLINNRLIVALQPAFGEPSFQYQDQNPQLSKLFDKKDVRIALAKGTMTDGPNPISDYIKASDPRPMTVDRVPQDIRPETLVATYANNNVPTSQAKTIFRERYTDTVLTKTAYYEGGAMLIFAIITLILSYIYK